MYVTCSIVFHDQLIIYYYTCIFIFVRQTTIQQNQLWPQTWRSMCANGHNKQTNSVDPAWERCQHVVRVTLLTCHTKFNCLLYISIYFGHAHKKDSSKNICTWEFVFDDLSQRRRMIAKNDVYRVVHKINITKWRQSSLRVENSSYPDAWWSPGTRHLVARACSSNIRPSARSAKCSCLQ